MQIGRKSGDLKMLILPTATRAVQIRRWATEKDTRTELLLLNVL